MTLSEAITKTYLLAEGKGTAPAATSNKYSKIVGLLNVCQEMWQDEPDSDWDSLYDNVTLAGTITATDTFALGATVREISQRDGNYVKITCTDGNVVYVPLVRADQLNEHGANGSRVCAKVGSNLVFSIAFTTSSAEFGGTVQVPAYTNVATLSGASDVIQVDKPLWLCYMAAAEYCRTSTSLGYRTDELVQRANQLMQDMKQAQGASQPTAIKSHNVLGGRTW